MKDEHVKGAVQGAAEDVTQGAAEDVTQGIAEDVLGAAENGCVKVFIVARVIFQRRNPRHARP